MMRLKVFLSLILFFLFSVELSAQTLRVGSLDNIEDAYRRLQLLGKDTTGSSFMIRPLAITKRNNYDLSGDSTGIRLLDWNLQLWRNKKESIAVYALPIEWQQQFNSHHPYGMNDGAMIPAKGYQTLISGGIYAKIGPFSVQFRPEYVFAENKPFREMSMVNNEIGRQYSSIYNYIDLPDRFGNQQYSKFNWGQSNVLLNVGPVSAGFSNENLWWGPGIRSSLLMSNNAPGFKHATLHTNRPIKTPIGSFEGQVIGGKLDASGVALPAGEDYKAKPPGSRYISGMAFTYQPKWVPNLYLGFDRSFIMYHNMMGGGLKSYLPIFSSVEKSGIDKNGDGLDEATPRDQLISFFGRWVMPESKAEVYFQYGREDHSYNLRDFIVEPEHSRAYILGFRKLMPLKRANEYIQFGLELTQLESPGTRSVRPAGYWYTHSAVRDGYTHLGQVLGAGVGPGSNLQSLEVSWVKGLKRIGFQVERLTHNNDLMYKLKALDVRRNWVDLGFTGGFSWDYKRFVLNSQLSYIHSFNYQYILENGQVPSFWKFEPNDVNNFHVKVGLMYLFGSAH